VKTRVASLFGTIAPQDVVLLKSIEMLECSLRLLLHYLKDGTVHIPANHYFQQRRESYMSKAYPSNLLRLNMTF